MYFNAQQKESGVQDSHSKSRGDGKQEVQSTSVVMSELLSSGQTGWHPPVRGWKKRSRRESWQAGQRHGQGAELQLVQGYGANSGSLG